MFYNISEIKKYYKKLNIKNYKLGGKTYEEFIFKKQKKNKKNV